MEFNENSLLATMNPLVLIICFVVMVIIAYVCAYIYKDIFDFKKSSKLYCMIAIPTMILFVGIKIPLILVIGYIISGFIIMAMISNHFFRN